MNHTQMTPENSSNAIISGPDFPVNSDNIKDKSPKIVAPVTHEYQCIVCNFIETSPAEMHQHQIRSHTAEELSLSIIGLQILYNMHKSCFKGSSNKVNTDETAFNNFISNQKANYNNERSQVSISSLKTEKPIYPEVQKEPICLKISNPNSLQNILAENPGLDLKTMLQMKCYKSVDDLNKNQKLASKKSRPKILSTKTKKSTPLGQREFKKIVTILPKIVEPTIQSRSKEKSTKECDLKNFIKLGVSTIIQSVNISENASFSYEGNHVTDKISPIRKESSNISHCDPNCLKIASKSLLKPQMIIQKSEVFQKPQGFLKIPEGKLGKSEVTIEKVEAHFKKPETIIKKPVVTIKRMQIIKQPKQQTNFSLSEHQIKLKTPEVKSGNFNKNLNNLCNNIQQVYFQKERFESPLQKIVPSLQNLDQIQKTLQKVESPFQVLDQIQEPLQKPESPSQILELLQKPESPSQILEPLQKPESPSQILVLLQKPGSPSQILEPLQKPESSFQILEPLQKSELSFQIREPLQKTESHLQVLESFQKTESPLQILEPLQKPESPFQILKPLQKSQSPLQILEPLLQTPELPLQNPEPPKKKFKSFLNFPREEEIKNKIFFKSVKTLPILEVVDDGWGDLVKEKLYLGSELPTDITKIAMQDLPNMQNFEASQNVSKNFNHNDLSNEICMNLDSYLMTPETQSLDGDNSNSQGMNLNNNLTLQISNYQTMPDPVSGYDYSNADDLIFENNQSLVSPADPNENAWMHSDANPIYTELLPVFYH